MAANGTNTATVELEPLSDRLLFANPGATILAEITALAQVTASVLAGDAGPGQRRRDHRRESCTTRPPRTSNGGGGGASRRPPSKPTPTTAAAVRPCSPVGCSPRARSRSVPTRATPRTPAYVINIGILGSSIQTGSFADVGASGRPADALDSALIGGTARISSPAHAITVSVIRGAIATAASRGGGGGFVGSAGLRSTSNTRGGASARVENGAVVGTDTGRPGALTVRATDASVAAANSSVGSGGFVSSAESRAVALSAPTVSAYLDNGVAVVLQDGTGHDVTVQALSNRAEADALANNSGGGGVDVASTYAETNSLPVVRAYVGTGTTVRIGGSLTVDAQSLALPSSNIPLTDQITALVVHGAPPPATIATWDSVQFVQHGLSTGDQVLYESTGPPITGLRSGHLYSVIVLDANNLRFGVTFTGALIDATALGTVSGVDPLRSMIRFAGPHHFENGDAVVYRTSGSTILPGVADGTVLYVRVIDANTIELYTTAAAATQAAIPLTGPGAAPIAANQITNSTLADGTRVTYQSAPPLPFTNVGVNVTVDGTGKVTGTNPTAYNIFLGTITVPGVNPTIVGHGLSGGAAGHLPDARRHPDHRSDQRRHLLRAPRLRLDGPGRRDLLRRGRVRLRPDLRGHRRQRRPGAAPAQPDPHRAPGQTARSHRCPRRARRPRRSVRTRSAASSTVRPTPSTASTPPTSPFRPAGSTRRSTRPIAGATSSDSTSSSRPGCAVQTSSDAQQLYLQLTGNLGNSKLLVAGRDVAAHRVTAARRRPHLLVRARRRRRRHQRARALGPHHHLADGGRLVRRRCGGRRRRDDLVAGQHQRDGVDQQRLRRVRLGGQRRLRAERHQHDLGLRRRRPEPTHR